MKKVYIYIIILILCLGCKKTNKNIQIINYKVIDIVNPIEINIEELVREYEIIVLETKDESLLYDIFQLKIIDNYFYILDGSMTSIFIFDHTGNFINKINNIGNGPNEYLKIESFEVDKINKKIIISDAFSKRIFVYDQEGNQENVIQLNFQPLLILSNGEYGYINLYSGIKGLYDNETMEKYNIHLLDKEGKYIRSYKKNETDKRIDLRSKLAVQSFENGDILYQPVLSDTIYCIRNNIVEPYFVLNNKSNYKILSENQRKKIELKYGEKNMIEEMENKNYLLPIGNVLDLKDYFFTTFGGWDIEKTMYLYYSKEKNKSLTFLRNKVKGNEGYKEIFLTLPNACYENDIYISPHPFIIDTYKNKLPESKLKDSLNNIDLEDNPVIIKFKVNIEKYLD